MEKVGSAQMVAPHPPPAAVHTLYVQGPMGDSEGHLRPRKEHVCHATLPTLKPHSSYLPAHASRDVSALALISSWIFKEPERDRLPHPRCAVKKKKLKTGSPKAGRDIEETLFKIEALKKKK